MDHQYLSSYSRHAFPGERHCDNCRIKAQCLLPDLDWSRQDVHTRFTIREGWDETRMNFHMRRVMAGMCNNFEQIQLETQSDDHPEMNAMLDMVRKMKEEREKDKEWDK